jgi:hypothetical protein
MHSIRQRSPGQAPGAPPPLAQLVEEFDELAVQRWHFLDEVDEVAALQAWLDRDVDELAYDAAGDLELLAQLRDRVDERPTVGVR